MTRRTTPRGAACTCAVCDVGVCLLKLLQAGLDRVVCSRRLLQLLAGIEAKVNLIGFNSHAGTHFKPSTTAAVLAFRSRLIAGGRVCTVRESRGDDEMAACGQLGDIGVGSTKLAPVLQPPAHLLEAMSVA